MDSPCSQFIEVETKNKKRSRTRTPVEPAFDLSGMKIDEEAVLSRKSTGTAPLLYIMN